MRSKFYLATLAAITLAACSNDDLLTKQTQNDDSNIIAFRAAAPKSRADETTITTIQENGFWVRAVKSDGTNLWDTDKGVLKFSYDETAGYYTAEIPSGSDISMKWPDEEVSFYAFNKEPHDTYLKDYNPVEWYLYQMKNVPEQEDFIYATNKGTSADFGSKTIPLNFKHPFVQVEIRAKCTSDVYDVRVKGYKIHYSVYSNPFTLPEPVTTESVITSHNSEAQPDGTWSSKNPNSLIGMYTLQPSQDILSGFYGGYTTADANNSNVTGTKNEDGSISISVNDIFNHSHYIDLNKKSEDGVDVQISNGEDGQGTNTAFLLPPRQSLAPYDPDTETDTNSGVYIALLVQVNYKDGSALFPARNETTGKRICYRGLPLYYGYIYVPIDFKWEDYTGKKVVFTLDLTDGLGKVDAHRPDTVDPDTYDPETDSPSLPLDEDKKGDTDPYTPNQNVLDQYMHISIDVQKWDEVGEPIVMQ